MTADSSYGYNYINSAGERFRTYLEVKNFAAATTYFKKKTYSTWIHPRSKKPHQINHFVTSKGGFSRFIDAGCTSPVLDSDHLAVMCKLRIAARLKKRTKTARQQLLKLDTTFLKDKEEVRSSSISLQRSMKLKIWL